MHQVHTQDTAEAIFSFRGRPAHQVVIEQVREYWTPRAKREVAAIMTRMNRSLRRYIFDPGLEPTPSPPAPTPLRLLPEDDAPHIVADEESDFGA